MIVATKAKVIITQRKREGRADSEVEWVVASSINRSQSTTVMVMSSLSTVARVILRLA